MGVGRHKDFLLQTLRIYSFFIKCSISDALLISSLQKKSEEVPLVFNAQERSMFNEIKKRAGREGGQILVTENVNAQGASGLHALSSGTETTIIPEEEKANAEENISTESRAGAHARDAETSEDGLQNRYKPKSHAESLGTMIPKFMRSESEAALANLVTKYGSVDEFVKRELGYSTLDEMYKGLAAEQIDGVALAIDNIKNGDSIVIGDQTGIGKGCQAAWMRRRGTGEL